MTSSAGKTGKKSMSARFPDKLVPTPKKLQDLFRQQNGSAFRITRRDIRLLSAWESAVRPQLLARSSKPTAEPHRWRLPDEREGLVHRFTIPAGASRPEIRCPHCGEVARKGIVKDLKGYLKMGFYPDGTLGELFLTMDRAGSQLRGFTDGLMFSLSVGLQHGIPLRRYIDHFRNTQFPPHGFIASADEDLQGFASSILDYVAKYLNSRFPAGHTK